jgi:hypothetical protein
MHEAMKNWLLCLHLCNSESCSYIARGLLKPDILDQTAHGVWRSGSTRHVPLVKMSKIGIAERAEDAPCA